MIFAAIADWADSDEYEVKFMCIGLGVSTSGFHAWRGRKPSVQAVQDAALTPKMMTARKDLHSNPGVRRMWAHLTRRSTSYPASGCIG